MIRILLFFCLIISGLFSLITFAEERDNLLQAYQRELTHLSSQKIQLEALKAKLSQDHKSKLLSLQTELTILNRRLAQSQVENETLTEKYLLQEKDYKVNLNRKMQLESLWKRITTLLLKTRNLVNLQHEDPEKLTAPDGLSILEFKGLKNNLLSTLNSATEVRKQINSFYSQEGHLVESEVVRWGALAAYAKNGDELSLLQPSEQNILQIVPLKHEASFKFGKKELETSLKMIPIYLFDSLNEKPLLAKPAGWADYVVRSLPMILLLGLFTMVIGLFISLARH
jgi:hypothetical protein